MTQSTSRFQNYHATCLIINSIGIMIEGPSGSGKTCLALGLMEAALTRNIDSAFVCDDQAMLNVKNGTLWANTPPALAGKVELFGHGIIEIDFTSQCKISLVCRQTPQSEISRMPAPSTCNRMGVDLPLINTPERHEAQGVRLIFQALSIPPQGSLVVT